MKNDIIDQFIFNLIYELLFQALIFICICLVISVAIACVSYVYREMISEIITDITGFFRQSKKPVYDELEDDLTDPFQNSCVVDDIIHDIDTDLSFLFKEGVVFDVKDEQDADHVEYQTAFEWEWNDITDQSNIEINHQIYAFDRHHDHLYEDHVDQSDITRDL